MADMLKGGMEQLVILMHCISHPCRKTVLLLYTIAKGDPTPMPVVGGFDSLASFVKIHKEGCSD